MNYKNLTPITREDYKEIHNDYKWVIKWVPHMLQNNNWATVYVPIIFVEPFIIVKNKYNSIISMPIDDNWEWVTKYLLTNNNLVVDWKKIKELWFSRICIWVLENKKWVNIHWIYEYKNELHITEDVLLKYYK